MAKKGILRVSKTSTIQPSWVELVVSKWLRRGSYEFPWHSNVVGSSKLSLEISGDARKQALTLKKKKKEHKHNSLSKHILAGILRKYDS